MLITSTYVSICVNCTLYCICVLCWLLCSLDSSNILEFPLKWQKGKGLDPMLNSCHADYLNDMCSTLCAAVEAKISSAAQVLSGKLASAVYDEVLWHATYCKRRVQHFVVSGLHGQIHVQHYKAS